VLLTGPRFRRYQRAVYGCFPEVTGPETRPIAFPVRDKVLHARCPGVLEAIYDRLPGLLG